MPNSYALHSEQDERNRSSSRWTRHSPYSRLSYLVIFALSACSQETDSPQPSPDDASGAGASGGDSSNGGSEAVGTGGGPAHFRECKRGVAMTDLSPGEMQVFARSSGWFYDWGLVPPVVPTEELDWELEFVPMVWTGTPDVEGAVAAIPNDAKYLLGFNEPNFKSQANLRAEDAAAIWPQLEAIAAARELKLVSPAVNFCGPATECWGTDPFEYLDAFFSACTGCRVDYIAIHGYFDNVGGLTWYLDEAKSRYNLPIWLTEFNQSPGDEAAQLAFMQQAIPILEADPMVFRYSWFMARSTVTSINLLNLDGSLTDLGRAYTTLPGDCFVGSP